jgi:DNA-3-methyladenine glycosylase II
MRKYQLALRRAEKHLSSVDRRLAKVVARHGRCELLPKWDLSPYESLVQAVAHQQLHAKAAAAILQRLQAKFPHVPFPTPPELANADVAELRSCGLSLAKVTAIQGIASGALSGVVPNREHAEAMTDEALIEQISTLRGIGRWTVEMLLIFTLGRLDVMPCDDYGVKVGLQHLHGLPALPKKQDFARLTQAWQPYRSIGAWYLWREADRLKSEASRTPANQ